jgi:hypothetical protein
VNARFPLIAVLAVIASGCGTKGKPHPIVVGAFEDAPKVGDPTTKMALARRAGFRAIVMSSVWAPPRTAPTSSELADLRGAVRAAVASRIRPIVAVYSFSPDTPLTARARGQFAAYATSIVRELPAVRDVVVGNEPNLNLFWLPQFGPDGSNVSATAYLALLAQTYDALKEAAPGVNVIGGSLAAHGGDDPLSTRHTTSPARFIEDLGAAYRASGRSRPVMDMFSLHPYPENSTIPPTFEHPKGTSIGLADYDKLVGLLGDAFDGTAQSGSSLPIVYGEYGLETEIPAGKQDAYAGVEPPTTKPVDEATQAQGHVDAIALAACSPNVRMLIFFHVSDEVRLEGLQTGVYDAEDTPKASLGPVAQAAREAAAGRTECLS